MPKQTLVEVNAFAKLLSYFFDKKAKGEEADLDDKFKNLGTSPAYKKAYDNWRSDSDKLMQATRNLLIKNGLDTKSIDAVIDKYAK
jgi:hypothetical protein